MRFSVSWWLQGSGWGFFEMGESEAAITGSGGVLLFHYYEEVLLRWRRRWVDVGYIGVDGGVLVYWVQ